VRGQFATSGSLPNNATSNSGVINKYVSPFFKTIQIANSMDYKPVCCVCSL
jgi:hypothetical protein